jgi:hypothetical protein
MQLFWVSGDLSLASLNLLGGVPALRRLNDIWGGAADPEPGESIELRLVDDTDRRGPPVLTDCPCFTGLGLLLSPRAVEALAGILRPAGFLMGTRGLPGEWRLFVARLRLPALDAEGSEATRMPDGRIIRLLRPVFRPGAIGRTALFTDMAQPTRLQATDAMVEAVERHGLTGFAFQRIWSAGGGGEDLNAGFPPIEPVPGAFDRRARGEREAMRARLAAGGPGRSISAPGRTA